jgi:methylmalonyl-CoA mutase
MSFIKTLKPAMNDTKQYPLLFNEFPPVTRKEWKDKILEVLKGADYEKKLIWHTLEKFNIRPYYRKDDLEGKEYMESLPGEYPYVRGNNPDSNDWEIRQDILLEDIEVANQKSLFVLDRGITSLGFICPAEKVRASLRSQNDFSRLLKDIYFDCIGLYFVAGHKAPDIFEMLKTETGIKQIDPSHIEGAVDFDPLGYLTTLGKFNVSETEDFRILKKLLLDASANLPNYRVLAVNGYFFNNAGASAVQELGYSLSMAADYLNHLTDAGVSVDTICHHMQFNLGVGSNYFMEIAKIRAARLLWTKIVEAYKPDLETSKQVYIHSVTTEWNQTIYDPYINVLRATTEAMAAVIGGTDSLTVHPFTFSYKPTTKFSGRIARNIQIILKEEAYMGKIADPSAGSYYIENLTHSIIEEAWKIFLKVEEEGGYLETLKKGIVRADIEATAQNRNNLIATRREILLGTNQYPNPDEKMKDEVVPDIAFPPSPDKDTDIKPLRKYRGAGGFEKLRLATEKHPGKQPVVFLLPCGDPIMRKARADFSASFFACAGYKIIDNAEFATPEEGISAALNAGADIIALCSSDVEYADLAPAVFNVVNKKAIVVVAGAPACMDELKAKGIENFIHTRSNALKTLEEFHRKLGIAL